MDFRSLLGRETDSPKFETWDLFGSERSWDKFCRGGIPGKSRFVE